MLHADIHVILIRDVHILPHFRQHLIQDIAKYMLRMKNTTHPSAQTSSLHDIPEDTLIKKMEKFPPSVKFVFKLLDLKGMLTQKEIIRETYLPPRTVRYALKRLRAEGLIEEKLYVKDARQCLYGLKNPVDEEESSNFPCGFI